MAAEEVGGFEDRGIFFVRQLRRGGWRRPNPVYSGPAKDTVVRRSAFTELNKSLLRNAGQS